MILYIEPLRNGWQLRKGGTKKVLDTFTLRRDAIKAAKKLIDKDGVIFVHNSNKDIVVRIPELPVNKVAAAVWIKRASDMSVEGRQEIAKWLRMHASYILKHGKEYSSNFRGRYYYA